MEIIKYYLNIFTDREEDIENSVALNLICTSSAEITLDKSIRPPSVTDILVDTKQKKFISDFDTDKTDDEDNKNLIDITGK